MKNLYTFLTFTALVSFSPKTFADDTSRGCGVGSLAAPQKTLVSTSIAGTVDYFVPSQTFGLTSGTSGCAKHSLVLNQKMQEHFIAVHLEQIKLDSAIGGGESIEVLARTFGCNDQGSDFLGAKLQFNFERLAPQDAKSFQKSVNELVKKDQSLKNACPLSV